MAVALFFDPPRRHWDDTTGDLARSRPASSVAIPSTHADTTLIEALRAGDVTVFESLYMSHAAAVHEFVQGYVSADVADDITQDIFVALWNRRATLVVHRSIRAYLFGAARLRALQYQRNMRTSSTLHAAQAQDDSVAPSDSIETAEIRSAVNHALMTLPGRTRELLALRWVYGMSYTEAAAVLGVSPEAAKKLGRRAEHTLAPLLEHFRN